MLIGHFLQLLNFFRQITKLRDDQGNTKQIRISLAIQSEKKMMENSVNLKHRHRAPQLTYNYVDLCIINSKKQWLNICTAKFFLLIFFCDFHTFLYAHPKQIVNICFEIWKFD